MRSFRKLFGSVWLLTVLLILAAYMAYLTGYGAAKYQPPMGTKYVKAVLI